MTGAEGFEGGGWLRPSLRRVSWVINCEEPEPDGVLAADVAASSTVVPLVSRWTQEAIHLAIEFHDLLEVCRIVDFGADWKTLTVIRGVGTPAVAHSAGSKVYAAWPLKDVPDV